MQGTLKGKTVACGTQTSDLLDIIELRIYVGMYVTRKIVGKQPFIIIQYMASK